MSARKIFLIIGIVIAIFGLNYLLDFYNEKVVDVNSRDYIFKQFSKENIGNKKYFKQNDPVVGLKDYVVIDDNNVEEYIYAGKNIWNFNGKIEIVGIGNGTGVEIKNVEVQNIPYEKVVCDDSNLGKKVFIVNKNTKLGKIIYVAKDGKDVRYELSKYGEHFQANDICTTNVTNMKGIFNNRIGFNQPLDSWDTSSVTDMSGMFVATQFNQDISSWNTSIVTNMSGMFYGAELFNQPLDNWNTSSVKDMSGMFKSAIQFNQALNSWDTSNVIDMSEMFRGAKKFNESLNNWDTSKVTNMKDMFGDAELFNQSLNSWNTSNVTNMSWMFSGAKEFNQPLNSWDTSKVTNMSRMFVATQFNQDISSWNTSRVTDMSSMFSGAKEFNQALDSWDISNVTDMSGMFKDAENFNQPLDSWDTSNVKDMREMFKGAIQFKQKTKQIEQEPKEIRNISDIGKF